MGHFLNDTVYSHHEMDQKITEYHNLLKLHNSIRTIVDMVKTDEILKDFYEEALKSVPVESYIHGESPYDLHEPEVYVLRKTLLLMRNAIYETPSKNEKMQKYLYRVDGVDEAGEEFISQCISTDIHNALHLYRKSGKDVHRISRVTDVCHDETCAILEIKKK